MARASSCIPIVEGYLDDTEGELLRLQRRAEECLLAASKYKNDVNQMLTEVKTMRDAVKSTEASTRLDMKTLGYFYELEECELPDAAGLPCMPNTSDLQPAKRKIHDCFVSVSKAMERYSPAFKDGCNPLTNSSSTVAPQVSVLVRAPPKQESFISPSGTVLKPVTQERLFSTTDLSTPAIKKDNVFIFKSSKQEHRTPNGQNSNERANSGDPAHSDSSSILEDDIEDAEQYAAQSMRNLIIGAPKRHCPTNGEFASQHSLVERSSTGLSNVPTGQSTIPRRALREKAEYTVFCDYDARYGYSPYNFWLQVDDSVYEELAIDINRIVNEGHLKPLSKSMAIRGEACLAKFEGAWYRAVVLTPFDETRKGIRVRYIDYGNMAYVALSDTLEIPSAFRDIQWQAFPASLCGIQPIRSTWNSAAITDFFKDHVARSEIKCYIERLIKQGRFAVVKLYSRALGGGVMNVGEALVNKGLAAKLENIDELCALIESTQSAETDVQPRPQFDLSVSASGPSPSNDIFHGKIVAAINAHIQRQDRHHWRTCTPLPVEQEFEVRIVAWRSPDDFAIRLTGDDRWFADEVPKVNQDFVEELFQKEEKYGCNVSKLALYWSESQQRYCRGEVLEFVRRPNLEGYCEILDIDSGELISNILAKDLRLARGTSILSSNRAAIRARLCRNSHGDTSGLKMRSFEEVSKRLQNATGSCIIGSSALMTNVAAYAEGREALPVFLVIDSTGNEPIPITDLVYYPSAALSSVRIKDEAADFDDDETCDQVFDEIFTRTQFFDNPDRQTVGIERDDGEKLCKFYARRAICPRGQYCSFRHVVPKEGMVTASVELVFNEATLNVPYCPLGEVLSVKIPTDLPFEITYDPLEDDQFYDDLYDDEVSHSFLNSSTTLLCFDAPELKIEREQLEADLTEITAGSQQAFGAILPSIRQLVAVAIKTSEVKTDRRWVRGVVRRYAPNSVESKLVVELVDHGISIIADVTAVRPMPAIIAKSDLPRLSLMFRIKGGGIALEMAKGCKKLVAEVVEPGNAADETPLVSLREELI